MFYGVKRILIVHVSDAKESAESITYFYLLSRWSTVEKPFWKPAYSFSWFSLRTFSIFLVGIFRVNSVCVGGESRLIGV